MKTLGLAAPALALVLTLVARDTPQWFEETADLATIPPPAAERAARLAQNGVDLAAATKLAETSQGGRATAARLHEADEPFCVVDVQTEQGLVRVQTDAAGARVMATRPIPRFPGSPTDGEWQLLPSGVMINDLVVGDGETPRNSAAWVKVRYSGWLLDGTRFDGTEGGAPRKFRLNRVIDGWRDAMLDMHVGGKRKILIPWDQAYGERGNAPNIPPRATLVFDVELVALAKR